MVFRFDPNDFKDGLPCIVCILELDEGEKTQNSTVAMDFMLNDALICGFIHIQLALCAETLFLIRLKFQSEYLFEIRQTQEESTENGDSQTFLTNILFWGYLTEVSMLTSQFEEANNHHHTPISTSFFFFTIIHINNNFLNMHI